MTKLMKRFLRGDEGATMVEYALMVALVALVAAVGVEILGGGLSTMFTAIGTALSGYTVP